MIPQQIFVKYNSFIDDLNATIGKAQSLLAQNPRKKTKYLFSYSIFFKIIYGYKAIIQLLKNTEDFVIEANNILRSIVESLFVLKYLSTNPCDAIKRLEKNYEIYQNKRKVDILKHPDLKDLRIYIKDEEIEEIFEKKKENHKETGIKKWSNLSHLSRMYHLPYDTLSVESHTNLKSISDRIQKIDDRIEFIRPDSPEDYDRCFITTIIVIMISLETIENIFKIDIKKDIETIDKEFLEIQRDNSNANPNQ